MTDHPEAEPASPDPLSLGPAFNLHIRSEDGRPVYEVYSTALDDVLRAAQAAEILGFGWVASGYYCAAVDGSPDTEEREYHLTAWRNLTSETGPWTTRKDAKP